MRRVWVLGLAALALAALLGGCGSKEEAASLTIWQTYNDEESPVFREKLAKKNALLPIEDRVPQEFVADVFPVALASCRYRGHLWGLPDQTNGLCLFYNTEMFRAAGLDPHQTLQEI